MQPDAARGGFSHGGSLLDGIAWGAAWCRRHPLSPKPNVPPEPAGPNAFLPFMTRLSNAIGVILIVTGVAAYVGTGMTSWTALIPAFLGLLFIVLGALGGRPGWFKPAMIGAAIVAVIGLLGSIGGFGELLALLSGDVVERPVAAIAQSLTAFLCLFFLVAGGRMALGRGPT